MNGQYLPPAYDFSGYHHTVSGVADLSATNWNPVYTPREEYPYSFPGSSPIGKTRTKDKYRVVYTDHQRLELEKEFQCNRYITMRRKADLSMALGLSERQVKIWFQNRRAKERKINRKKLQHSQQASTTTPTPPVLRSRGVVVLISSCQCARGGVNPGKVGSLSQGNTETDRTNNHSCTHSHLRRI
uniref:Caudal type homeobox 1a n=1 Tax=Fundulus heteroclitus TaxID=8078 RepID=A0A3Q2PJC9_FUNHE